MTPPTRHMPWTLPAAEAATARARALAALIPEVQTERLILRAPRLADWPVLRPIWTTARGAEIGGPYDEDEAWRDFLQFAASWLLAGYGGRTIVRRSDGAVLGLVTVGLEVGDPEPEIGWFLTAEAEGQGYATEAAAALLPEARRLFPSLVSYVAPSNRRSAAIASRLGARRDPAAEQALRTQTGEAMQVWRHEVPA